MAIRYRAVHGLFTPSLALLLAGSLAASAQTTQQAIEARLKGKPLYLRGLWGANDLKFDPTGTVLSPSILASFALSGIDIKKVQVTDNRVEITGDRVGLEFRDYTPERVSLHTKVHIVVAGSSGADYGPSLDKIFAADLTDLVPSMPFYWQRYAQEHLLPGGMADKTKRPKPQLPAHMVQVIEQPEAEYTDTAKGLNLTGISTIHITVKEDGSIRDPYIVYPLGLGLDEEALRAIAHYRFKPATDTNGIPVAMELNIEVNFQLLNH